MHKPFFQQILSLHKLFINYIAATRSATLHNSQQLFENTHTHSSFQPFVQHKHVILLKLLPNKVSDNQELSYTVDNSH